jgi:hypothetical protein
MKASAPNEALAGVVERVTFHNGENGFCVLRVLQRRQILPLQVFDGGDAQAVVIGQAAADFDGDGVIPIDFAAFLQEFQGAVAAFAANDAVMLPFAFDRPDDKVLQQAVIPDAGRKALNAMAVHFLARVAPACFQ